MPDLPRETTYVPLRPTEAPAVSPEAASLVSRTLAHGAGQLETISAEIYHRAALQTAYEGHLRAHAWGEQTRAMTTAAALAYSQEIQSGKVLDQNGQPIDPSQWTNAFVAKTQELAQVAKTKAQTDLGDYADIGMGRFYTGFNTDITKHLEEKIIAAQNKAVHSKLRGDLTGILENKANLAEAGKEEATIGDIRTEIYKGLGSQVLTPGEQIEFDKHYTQSARLGPYRREIALGHGDVVYRALTEGRIVLPVDETRELRNELLADAGHVGTLDAQKRAAENDKRHRTSEDTYMAALPRLAPHLGETALGFTELDVMRDKGQLEGTRYHELYHGLEAIEAAGGPGDAERAASLERTVRLHPERYNANTLGQQTAGLNKDQVIKVFDVFAKATKEAREWVDDEFHPLNNKVYTTHNRMIDTLRTVATSPISFLDKQQQKALLPVVDNMELDFQQRVLAAYRKDKTTPVDYNALFKQTWTQYAGPVARLFGVNMDPAKFDPVQGLAEKRAELQRVLQDPQIQRLPPAEQVKIVAPIKAIIDLYQVWPASGGK